MFFDAASVVAAHGWKIPASFGGRRARCIYGPIACLHPGAEKYYREAGIIK